MTREKKAIIIEELSEKLASTDYFYITDASGMTVAQINNFRRLCFDRGLEYTVFKNTMIKKALENSKTDYSAFNTAVLKGFSGIIFSPESGNLPAKVLKEFYKGGLKSPVFKGASVDTALFVGIAELETLVSLKSKQELVGEIIGLLQSPAKNVVSALQSGGQKLSGILKTLSEKSN